MDDSTSISSTSENGTNGSSMIQSKRDKFLSTYLSQNFALPDSIMYYIARNPPSPEVYEKLVKTCKYFFIKNPILIVPDLSSFRGEEWLIGETSLAKISSKLWLTGEFTAACHYAIGHADHINIVSSLIPKLYHSDVESLDLYHQVISFDDLAFLLASCKYINLETVVVKKKDGTNATIEDLVRVAVKAKSFAVDQTPFGAKLMEELVKIPHFSKLDSLNLYELTEIFDIEAFYAYMMTNKKTKFWLRFDYPISDEYKARLEEIVDEIVSTKDHDYKPPLILFYGMDDEIHKKLWLIYCSD